MKKKFVSIFLCVVVCSLSVIVPYYNVKATEVVAIGGLGIGYALLGTLAICGVGMEIENNRAFNDLSESEKERITNGLASSYTDVALQRGAGLQEINNWLHNLSDGVLDKSSECWDIFKSWATDVHIKDDTFIKPDLGVTLDADVLVGFSGVVKNGTTFNITTQVADFINNHKGSSKFYGYIIYQYSNSSYYQVFGINQPPKNGTNYVKGDTVYGNMYVFSREYNSNYNWYPNSSSYLSLNQPYLQGIYSSYPILDTNNTDYNGMGFSSATDLFNTNTEYLERLQGEKEGIIIDVTDIKNPIIEGQRNELTRIDFNRGSKRNNNDDDNKNELVYTPVTYEALDDYMIGQNNAITQYDNEITENPDEADKIFISPAPIVNINEFYNTLPVVDTPITNTVINNNYTYNNYTNNNVTLNDLPYNADLIPNIPTMIFENKFPFCIPYDMYTFLKVFYVEREAPTFTFDVPFPSENGLEVTQITLSLADFEYASLVLRVMWFLLFVFGLMLITRNLIKG